MVGLGLGLCFLAGSVGCTTLTRDQPSDGSPPLADQPAMKVPIGTLHVVRPTENFVLIQSTRFLQLEPGTEIVTYGRGGEETSRLQVSPARKGQFITADIVSGQPRVGDQALMDYAVNPGGVTRGTAESADDEIQVLE